MDKILFLETIVCKIQYNQELFIEGRAAEWRRGLNNAAADCQVELRTIGCMLKYGSLCVSVSCVCEKMNESPLVNVHVECK